MTLPSSGTITLLQVYTEAQLQPTSAWYDKGPNIGGYRGLQWWQDNTVTGFFSSGALSMSDFYSKRSFSPVTPGAYRFYISGYDPTPGAPAGATLVATSQSSSFVVPVYNILTISVYGGAGGGAGGQGGGGGEQPGGNGVASTFGSSTWYAYGDYGRRGTIGGSGNRGADGTPLSSYPAGGGGGSGGGGNFAAGGPGGNGGKTSLIVANPISGGGSGYPSGPPVGSTVSFFIGNGGGGGSGASSNFFFPGGYNGSPGQWGWIDVVWS